MLWGVLFVVTIFGPPLVWFWIVRAVDSVDPEPKWFLVKMFLWGVFLACILGVSEPTLLKLISPKSVGAFVESLNNLESTTTFSSSLQMLTALICAAIFEELAKIFILWEYIFDKKHFDQIADGAFYGMILGLGFAVTENIFYFFTLAKQDTLVSVLAISVRSITCVLLHITAAGFSGYAIGRMKFRIKYSPTLVTAIFLSAILLHVIYNMAIAFQFGVILGFLVAIVGFFFLLRLLNKKESKLIWKLSETGASGTS